MKLVDIRNAFIVGSLVVYERNSIELECVRK